MKIKDQKQVANQIVSDPCVATHAAIWASRCLTGYWPTLAEVGQARETLGLRSVSRQAVHPVMKRLVAGGTVVMRTDHKGRVRGIKDCVPLEWSEKDIPAIKKQVELLVAAENVETQS